jgi:hypothetical protein
VRSRWFEGDGDELKGDYLKETKHKRELSEIAGCYGQGKIISNLAHLINREILSRSKFKCPS